MASTSETRTYDALLSTTLENWAKGIGDTVTSSNMAYYMIRRSGSWKRLSGGLGERCRYALRTDNGNADTYDRYDVIDTSPKDGITAAFFDWVQLAVSISISRKEERQNAGEYAMLNLLGEKSEQARDGIIEKFNKAWIQGNGINSATAITTAYTSPTNGSTFFTPLALLVGQTPTNGTIGSISAAETNEAGTQFWANQKRAATDTNFATFMNDLSALRNDCSKGVGGPPDIHLTDQNTFQLYEKALRSLHQNPSYTRADIPFANLQFHGEPVTWDEFMPDWAGTTTTQSTTSGSWVMLNSKVVQIKVDGETDFITTPFIRPENQDAKTAQILWMGTLGTNNRRKLGVLSGIDTTLTS